VPDVSVPSTFPETVAIAKSLEDLKILWDEAVAGGFSKQVQVLISDRKKVLSQ
jgi:hypothetical protein